MLIFAADHGVACAGDVSAFPASVTAAMLAAFRAGRASISAFARVVGASVTAVDVGVGTATGDLRVERAVSPDRWQHAVTAGIEAVEQLDADVLVVGEMGIGNTTVAAAVSAALADDPVDVSGWVGRAPACRTTAWRARSPPCARSSAPARRDHRPARRARRGRRDGSWRSPLRSPQPGIDGCPWCWTAM